MQRFYASVFIQVFFDSYWYYVYSVLETLDTILITVLENFKEQHSFITPEQLEINMNL